MKHQRMHKVTMYNGDRYLTLEVNARDSWHAVDVARQMHAGIVVTCKRIPLKRPRRHWRSHQADQHCWDRLHYLKRKSGGYC